MEIDCEKKTTTVSQRNLVRRSSSVSSSRDKLAALSTLEKKNKQLDTATKELELKVKSLRQKSQLRNPPSTHGSKTMVAPPRAQSAPPRELPTAPSRTLEARRGSTVTSRIREREAEFSRQVQERDEQISRLKERLSLLSKKLTDNKESAKFPRDKAKEQQQRQIIVQEQGAELQSIIRQVTKERLQLERHLQIANDSLQRNNGVDLQKYLSLEQTNLHLRQQLDSLDILQQEHKLVEIQYREKEEACRELMNTLKYKSALCEDLESQLQRVIEKNTELTIANSDLQKKVVELQDVSEECQTLKSTLEKFETECVTARSEVHNLNGKVRNLESVLEEMHKAAENRREIERQHKEALENLKKKQEEVELNSSKKQEELMKQMKRKIEELEEEKREQNERHQELILEMAEMKKYGATSVGPESLSDAERPSDNLEIDEIMAKLEQDNKFLEDLEKQRSLGKRRESGSSDRSPTGSSSSSATIHRAGSAITDSGFLSTTSLNGSSGSPNSTGRNLSSASCGSLNKLPGLSGADKINLLNGRFSVDAPVERQLSPVNLKVEKDGSVEVPGKGWRFVYVARYSYDPFQHSPNESPEAELQVNAGDYILVWGDADEDGFFDGELLDGRRGLVPSNFVEKLEGEELMDFHRQVVLGLGDCDDSVCTSIPQDLDFISADEGVEDKIIVPPTLTYQHKKTDILPRYASCTDLDNTEDEETDGDGITLKRIPPPKQLTLETHLNKSLVIGWNPPDNFSHGKIEAFRVVVDGGVRSVVGASETRATVSGLDLSAIHRISVKTVSVSDGRTSMEAACTVVVGKDAPLGPTSVTATKIGSTSACISWIPSNSNFLHSISVNNVEVKTVKPGVFRHTLAGLQPDTSYKVTVRAKNIIAAPYNLTSTMTNGRFQDLSTSVEVRTLPRGPPEPPVDVEVAEGPTAGTLLISWLPVTINPTGTSNGAPVTGYAVYLDGRRVKDVEPGTVDQAVVDVSPNVVASPKFVAVRTKSGDKLSNESLSVLIPLALRNKVNSLALKKPETTTPVRIPEEPQKIVTDLSCGARLRDYAPGPALMVNYSGYPELDSDIGPSELSDIAEEPEEGLTDSDSDRSTPHFPSSASQQHLDHRRKPISESVTSLNRWSKNGSENNLHLSSAISSQAASQKSKPAQLSQPVVPVNPPLAPVSVAQTTKVTVVNNKPAIRIFVALFDYDPPTMSPNPDACEEELPFREGQLIKVYGEKDADGFYWGEAGNRTGYVPCNMVSEVQVDDEKVAEELFREQSSPGVSATASSRGDEDDFDERWGDIYEDAPARRKLALYDYDPSQLSPNVDSEVELSFRAGDILLIFGDMDDDGFFMGELHGRRGLVPSNFLTDVPTSFMRAAFAESISEPGSKAFVNLNGSLSTRPNGVQKINNGGVTVVSNNRAQPRVLGQQRRWS